MFCECTLANVHVIVHPNEECHLEAAAELIVRVTVDLKIVQVLANVDPKTNILALGRSLLAGTLDDEITAWLVVFGSQSLSAGYMLSVLLSNPSHPRGRNGS